MSCYLDMLDKLQEWVSRPAGATLTDFLKNMACCQECYFGWCSLGLSELGAVPFSHRGLLFWLVKKTHQPWMWWECLLKISWYIGILQFFVCRVYSTYDLIGL